MAEKEPRIPVILGETASGKTSVGIQLARLLGGEVISVDSRKVYKGLPVGTATPEGRWVNDVFLVDDIPHHLMGQLPPDSPYNAGDFARDADKLMTDIFGRRKIPVLVGGTGFYFKALAQGLPQLPPADETIRAKLENEIEKNGVEALYKKLSDIDPQAATAITLRDKHKIIRALEIHALTGRRFSDWKNEKKPLSHRRYAVMGIRFAKEITENRIEKRSQHMFDHGMIEETEAVLKEGYSSDCPALISFGYRDAVEVIQGKIPRSEFLPRLIQGTKAYSKRQRTWFRTQIKPLWFECDESSRADEISMRMKAFLDNSND